MKLKNILRGMSCISSIFPKQTNVKNILPYNPNLTSRQQDSEALAQDWRRVGQDIKYATKNFRKEYNLKNG